MIEEIKFRKWDRKAIIELCDAVEALEEKVKKLQNELDELNHKFEPIDNYKPVYQTWATE